MLKYIGRFYKSIAATHRVKRTAINNCSHHTTLTHDKTTFIRCYFHFSLCSESRQRKNKHFSSAVSREKIGRCRRYRRLENVEDEGRISAPNILHPQSVV